MKQIIIATFILAILTITASSVFAFKPGDDIIRECPGCHGNIIQETMKSGNTFGARSWTDARMVAPMLPDYPWLIKCPKCSDVFWVNEAKEVGRRKSWEKKGRWADAVEPTLPSEDDLFLVLQSNKLDRGKEIYVRQRIWWGFNDLIRYQEAGEGKPMPQRHADNLWALAGLLDENDAGSRILKAEIARELGEFDECRRLLTYDFKGNVAKTAAFIRELADSGDRRVREIKQQKSAKNTGNVVIAYVALAIVISILLLGLYVVVNVAIEAFKK